MKRSARALEALSSFVAQNGTALVPTQHVQDGYRLGSWVTYIRSRQRSGNVDQELGNYLESLPGWTWGPLPPGPGAKVDRNVEIIDRASKGESLSHLASEYGVSRQRIHQIVKRSTVTSSEG
jgi:hypothetical protein